MLIRPGEDLVANELRILSEMRRQGWISCPREAADHAAAYFEMLSRSETLVGHYDDLSQPLAITPSPLAGTLLHSSTVAGYLPSGQETPAGYTGISRLLVDEVLGSVVLTEAAYHNRDDRTHLLCEDELDQLRGMPFRHETRIASTGESSTFLCWFSPKREFQLSCTVALVQGRSLYEQVLSQLVRPLAAR